MDQRDQQRPEGQQLNSGKIAGDPRVTAYKRAAHLYCETMGMDPAQVMTAPHPTLAGVMLKIPVWYTVAERLFEFSVLARVIHAQAEEQRALKAQAEQRIATPSANDAPPEKPDAA